jgi:transposase
MIGAVAVERPTHPGAKKPVAQHGSSPADPSNPDSRVGRNASPVAQGRGQMDAMYVGIDVSKDRLDVHVRPTGEAFAVARDSEGLAALVARLQPLAPQLVAVEATGGFELTVAAAIGGAGLSLVVVNPAQVRHYAQALGRRAKTDGVDAEIIARFAEATRPEPQPLPDAATQALADLVTRRRQIIAMMVAERQRAGRLPKRLKRSCERVVRVLEKELAALDRDIDITVRGSPAWREKEDLLASVPSVGNVTARMLSPICPNSALSIAARSAVSSASPPSPGSRAAGKASPSSAGAGRMSAPLSSSPPCPPSVTIPPFAPSAKASLPKASPRWSSWSPACESFLLSSTRSSETESQGNPLDPQHSR